MIYLSELKGKKVFDRQGNRLGQVLDLVAELAPSAQLAGEEGAIVPELPAPSSEGETQEEHHLPFITGILVRKGGKQPAFYVPMSQVDLLTRAGVTLDVPQAAMQPHERKAGEILLVRDLWDKQVIDLESRHVERVNDVALGEGRKSAGPAPRLWVHGVDVGLGGLVRRLHLAGLVRAVGRRPLYSRVVPWAHLDVFGSNVPGGVAIHHKKLARLHPVEIARITDAVSYRQGAEIIAALDDTLAADTLEEISTTRQTDIVEYIPDERAADILEEMAPDEASDLLAELPEGKAGVLLGHMGEEEARPIRRLMRYDEDTAGGIMTTDFVRVLPNMTVAEVVQANKETFMSTDLIYYMYVVDEPAGSKLIGIITVRDLLVQGQSCLVSSFMLTEFISVYPGENKKEVARTMAEYNLIALPVVDDAGTLCGVVTVDDALDSLLPEGWQKRIPRIFS